MIHLTTWRNQETKRFVLMWVTSGAASVAASCVYCALSALLSGPMTGPIEMAQVTFIRGSPSTTPPTLTQKGLNRAAAAMPIIIIIIIIIVIDDRSTATRRRVSMMSPHRGALRPGLLLLRHRHRPFHLHHRLVLPIKHRDTVRGFGQLSLQEGHLPFPLPLGTTGSEQLLTEFLDLALCLVVRARTQILLHVIHLVQT